MLKLRIKQLAIIIALATALVLIIQVTHTPATPESCYQDLVKQWNPDNLEGLKQHCQDLYGKEVTK